MISNLSEDTEGNVTRVDGNTSNVLGLQEDNFFFLFLITNYLNTLLLSCWNNYDKVVYCRLMYRHN